MLLMSLALDAQVELLTYVTNDNTITISGHSRPPEAVTRISIPAAIDGLAVTAISQYAFGGCTNLTSITIPASVTSVGGQAFSMCLNLTSVYFYGNAPSLVNDVFADAAKATIYYLPGTSGWGSTYGGRPAVLLAPPAITSPLATGTALSGKTVALFAQVSGTPPLFYQWQFNGTNMVGATNASLQLANLTLADSGTYSLTVSNAYGVTNKDVVVLTVVDSAPFFVNQPQAQWKPIGSIPTFAAQADGSWPISYQWQFEGNAIAAATNPILAFAFSEMSQVGQYRLVASNAFGFVISAPVTLAVLGMNDLRNGLVAHYSFEEGQGSFIADQSGQGNHGGLVNPLPNTWSTGRFDAALSFDGVTGTHVAISNASSLQLTNTLTFAAWVRNDDLQRDAPILAKEGDTGRLSYWFGCFPSAKFGVLLDKDGFQGWELNDRGRGNISQGLWTHLASAWDSVTVRHYQDGALVGETPFAAPCFNGSSFVAIGINSEYNDTRFKGLIDDVRIYNRALSADEVFVLVHDKGQYPPRIISDTAAQTNYTGKSRTVSPIVAGSLPLSVQWQLNGTNILNATNAALQLADLTLADSGTYSLTVSNVYGITNKDVLVLTVVESPPFITTQPRSQFRYAGYAAAFEAQVDGSWPLSCQWYKDGLLLAEEERRSGATTSRLLIRQVMAEDAGSYTVVISNAFGVVTSAPAALTITSLQAATLGWQRWGYDLAGTYYYPFATRANIGNLAFTNQWFSPNGFGAQVAGKSLNAIYTADMNKDGVLELILGDGRNVRVFDGLGNLLYALNETGPLGLLADLTGDGVPELLCGEVLNENLARIRAFDLQGRVVQTFAKPCQYDTWIIAEAVLDMDQDGDLELVAKVGSGYSCGIRGFAVFDVASGFETGYYDTGPFPHDYNPPCIGPLLGDERFGILFGGIGVCNGKQGGDGSGDWQSFLWALDHRAQRLWRQGPLSDGGYYDSWAKLADVNQDGVLEVIAAAYGHAGYDGSRVHLRQAQDGTPMDGFARDFGGLNVLPMAVADLEPGGDLEIVLANPWSGGARIHIVRPTPGLPDWRTATFPGEYLRVCAVNDLNGDGRLEILAVVENRLLVLDNELTLLWEWRRPDNPTLPIQDAIVGDVTGDGINEIVVVSGDDTATRRVALLRAPLIPPHFLGEASVKTEYTGKPLTVTPRLTGTGPLTYQWQHNGVDVPEGTNASLQLSALRLSDSGTYSLTVSNVYGVTNKDVLMLTVVESPPFLLVQPTNQVVPVGRQGRLEVAADGSWPLACQWYFAGRPLAGATNLQLIFDPVNYGHSGQYYAVITNSFGAVTSIVATLSSPYYFNDFEQSVGPEWSVSKTDVTPVGNRRFLGQFGNQTVSLNVTNLPVHSGIILSFDLYIIRSWDGNAEPGGAAPDIWDLTVRNSTNLLHTTFAKYSGSVGQAYPANYPGVTNANDTGAAEVNSLGYDNYGDAVYRLSYYIAHEQPSAIFDFSATGLEDIWNESWGLDNVSVHLASLEPVIGTQTAVETNYTGKTLVVAPFVTGAPPLAYQWRFNGSDITGADLPSLRLESLRLADSGVYSLVVSNAHGMTTNELLWLTVREQGPVLLAQPSSQVRSFSQSARVGVQVDGSWPLNYQWYKSGVMVPDSNQPELRWPSVRLEDGGTYFVVISNAFGAVTSSVATLTVLPIIAWGNNDYGQTNVPVAAATAIRVEAGGDHNLALLADGTVMVWGSQSYVPAGISNAVAIAAGYGHNLVLKADGTVVAWGNNDRGQATVPLDLSGVVAIAAGGWHSLALKSDGTVVGWGNNDRGQAATPEGLSNAVAIAAGNSHSLALRSDGTVVAWGGNTVTVYWEDERWWGWWWEETVEVGTLMVPVGLSNVVAIAAGSYHNLALKSDGTVVTWGSYFNDYSPWGGYELAPASGLLEYSNIVVLAAGSNHDLALSSDGTVFAWGWNESGQTNTPAGLNQVTAIAAGGNHSLVMAGVPAVAGRLPTFQITGFTGKPLIFHAEALGSDQCQWQFNHTNLVANNDPILTLASLTHAHQGLYTVLATYSAGVVAWDHTRLTVVDQAPFVVAQPQSRTNFAGTTTVFQAAADGSCPLYYQWQFEGADLAGATNATLTLTAPRIEQAGNYWLLASNAFGTATSAPATLTLQAMSLTQTPQSQTLFVGQSASFSVTVQGNQLQYQWRHKGVALAGATNAVLVVPQVRLAHAGAYDVVVTNQYGSLTTPAALLTVLPVIAWGDNQYGQTAVPLTVTNAVRVAAGGHHTVVLKSDGTVAAWGRNHYGQATVPPDLSDVVAVAAGYSHSLALRDDGTVFRWGRPFPDTSEASIGINFHHSALGVMAASHVAGVISMYGWNNVDVGESGTSYNSPPFEPTPLWYADGNPSGAIVSSTLTSCYSGNSGSGTTTAARRLYSEYISWDPVDGIAPEDYGNISVTGLDAFCAGGYDVYVYFDSDSTARTFVFQIGAQSVTGRDAGTFNGTYTQAISGNAANYAVFSGLTNREFTLLADSSSGGRAAVNAIQIVPRASTVPTVLPVTDAQAIAAGKYYSLVLHRDGRVTAFDGWSGYPAVPPGLSNVTAIAAGDYHCLALKHDGTVVAWGKNEAGQTNVPANLAQVVAIAAGRSHSLALKSDGTVVAWGAYGIGPAAVPQDLSHVVDIAAGADLSLAITSDGRVIAWGSNASGQGVVPSELVSAVEVASGAAHAVALADAVAFQRPLRYATVFSGKDLLLSAQALAGGACQWLQGVQPIPGATSPVLTLRNLQRADEGLYTVVVTNAFGVTVWRHTQVTVVDAVPSVLSPPQSVTRFAGEDATFSVVADGSWPLYYQWRFEGVDIPDATNTTLALTRPRLELGGRYSVVVSNAFGAVTSAVATLTLLPPKIIAQPQPQTNFAGCSVAFTVAAQGCELQYQWEFNRQPLAEATNQSWVLSAPDMSQQGEYQVIVSSAYGGSATSAPASLLLVPLAITNHPASVAANLATEVEFSVGVDGAGPFAYQWYRNGQPVTGATAATLRIPCTVESFFGQYSVVVQNPYGCVTSAVAYLDLVYLTACGQNNVGQGRVTSDACDLVAMAAGNTHNLGLRRDGTVIAWGGQTTVPAEVSNIVAIATSFEHNLALRQDGRVVAWGLNNYGQTDTPAGLSNVVAIAAGIAHSLALRADGTVVGWGWNYYGQITPPADLTNAVAIAAGRYHSLALTRDGAVVQWGYNQYPLPASLSDVVAIAAGAFHNLALRADGSIYAWGNNYQGQTNVPASLTNAVAIACGFWHNLAIRQDGTVVAWGENNFGQCALPPGLGTTIAIAGGAAHSLFLAPSEPPAPLNLTAQTHHAGEFRLSLPTWRGKSFRLEYKDSLSDPSWRLLSPAPGDGTRKTLCDPSANGAFRFYRVRVQ